jgi:hypothetical protein
MKPWDVTSASWFCRRINAVSLLEEIGVSFTLYCKTYSEKNMTDYGVL